MDYFRLWTLFLIYFLHWCFLVDTNSIMSLVGSENGEFCITNSSSAMYYSTKSGSFYERTTIIPRSPYFCDFERSKERNKCLKDFDNNNGEWKIVNSLEYENSPIFDLRWEGLPVGELNVNEKLKPKRLSFRKMLDIEKMENFKVTISLRASEVHLLLCDVLKVSKASCYWFILQGWGGKKTVMRKCEKQIPVDNGEFPDLPCSVPLVSISHPIDYPKFLGMKRWSHVTLEKEGRSITLRHIRNNVTKTVLKYTEEGKLLNIKYLLGHTKDAAAFYKMHMNDYLRTTYSNTALKTPNENILSIVKRKICISVMLTTCADCWTNVVAYLPYQDSSGSIKILKIGEKQLPPSNGVWTEYKIKFNNVREDIYYFKIGFRTTTSNSDQSSGTFWSIDNYRQCSEEEYRVSLEKTDMTSCNLLTPKQNITWMEFNSLIPEARCQSWYRFGESCVPCDLLKEDGLIQTCKKLRVCELISENNRCFCSPGYTGVNCDKACEVGTYGYGCLQQCGNCLNNAVCSVEDGFCYNCEETFEGPTCKKPKRDIILKNGPSLIESSPTSCTVQLINTDYFGESKPNFYLVQYQKSAASKSHNIASGHESWKDWDPIKDITDDLPIMVEGLESSTSYGVRILIAEYEHLIKNLQNSKVPYTVCNTTCNSWNEEDIMITPGNSSVRIEIMLPQDRCKLTSYRWTIKEKSDSELLSGISKKDFTIGPLAIFTDYRIVFSGLNNIEKDFKTTESVPSEVHEIEQEGSFTYIIKLKWKEPRKPNGIIQYYRIEYTRIRGHYCIEKTWGDKKETNISTTFVELTDLTPFSVYIVTIRAANQKYESKALSYDTETAGSDEFSQDEGFAQVQLNITAIYERAVTLSVDNFICDFIRGPLQISYKCRCTSEWCEDTSERIGYIDSLKRVVSIKELQPYSNYSCSISFCRKSHCISVLQKDFRTKAAYANKIRQLTVTSKGPNYINLRWLSPYPPTGTLKYYKIITICSSCYSEHKNEIKFEQRKCNIWPDFICVHLTINIFNGYTTSVQIQAANEETGIFVNVHNVFKVHVREEPSEPPYGLKTKWQENNILELSWNHPNITNGNLKSFVIAIRVSDSSYRKHNYEVNEHTYQMTYHVKLDESIPPSSDVYIEITAENTYSSKPATKTDSSFPVTPVLVDPHISIINYTKSTISISVNVMLKVDKSINANYLFILITDPNADIKDENIMKLENVLHTTIDEERKQRMVAEINLNDLNTTELNFIVGENNRNNKGPLLNSEILNTPLHEGKYYNITVLLISEYKKKYRFNVYSIRSLTQGNPQMTTETTLPKTGENEEPSDGNGAYYALLLLFLVPLLIGALVYRKRITAGTTTTSLEKILDVATRHQTQSRSNNEILVLESTEPSPLLSSPIMKVKNKVSRKSTNPPNAAEKIHSKAIKVTNFEEYVKDAIQSGELERQHTLFPRGPTQPSKYGSMKVNKSKNRYNNLVAYDHSRVKLDKISGDEHSDYINASYIDGYIIPKAYIATQGPKSSTLVDFWRMVWQENVKYIVMLANIYENGKKKVEQYWPNINEELSFENISIQYVSVDTFADFEYKKFHVIRGNQIRKLEQLHFTSWPDHGVPLYPQSLVPFLRKILKIPQSSSSPIVIHCSAGVGRTGTILLSDICLRMAAKEGAVDMLNNLQKLREQRSNMVDNVEQYKLAHLIVLECLMGLHTSIPCKNIDESVEKLINEEEYKIQMDYLKETEWQDRAMITSNEKDEEFIIYPEKNRFQNIVPDNRSRIFLTRYPSEDSSSSYINAIQVDGFRCPGRFIVTQQPMPNTLNDFWRLVVERRISVLVSLNETNPNDETCCDFFPTPDNPELRPADFIIVKFGKLVTLEHYNIHSVRVWLTKSEQEKMDVDIISFKKWSVESTLPTSCEEFLSFWEEADTMSRRSKTVLVTCYDGRTASGVYVALCFVIEKIKLEQECDVCLAVRNVRHNRKQFLTEESQFVFLYEAALRYINGFQSYANFQNS